MKEKKLLWCFSSLCILSCERIWCEAMGMRFDLSLHLPLPTPHWSPILHHVRHFLFILFWWGFFFWWGFLIHSYALSSLPSPLIGGGTKWSIKSSAAVWLIWLVLIIIILFLKLKCLICKWYDMTYKSFSWDLFALHCHLSSQAQGCRAHSSLIQSVNLNLGQLSYCSSQA